MSEMSGNIAQDGNLQGMEKTIFTRCTLVMMLKFF